MKVAENFYIFPWQDPRANNCNTYVLMGRVPTVIDPGHEMFASGLLDEMRQDGIDAASIRMVINTHGHPDHIEANNRFKGPATHFAIHQAEYDYFQIAGRALFVKMGIQPPDNTYDILLQEGDLQLGEITLDVLHTPGHSPGGICLYWPEMRALFSGDTLFAMGVGRVDLPGGDAKALAQSISRLMELDIELLLPGHGPPIQGREEIREIFELLKTQVLPYL
jgi:hydroxyacylglutathione hydrolase